MPSGKLALAILAIGLHLAPAGRSLAAAPSELPERYAAWLEEVSPLILTSERLAFLRLHSDYQREAFIRQFWRVRDPYVETARNELKESYLTRVHQARDRYSTLEDSRARVYLVHGDPAGRLEVRCGGARPQGEVWAYEGSEQIRFSLVLIFLDPPGEEPARVWSPAAADSEIAIQQLRRCAGGEQLVQAAASIRAAGLDWELKYRRLLAKPRPRSEEWLDTFVSFTTDLPESAETFDAEVAIQFLGRYQHRTVTQGVLSVPVEAVTPGDWGGFRSFDFQLTGEVIREGTLFENFRYKFAFPADQLETQLVPLAFQRYLRPGIYSLILRLEDLHGERFFRHQQLLEVPQQQDLVIPASARDTETARLFAEATAAVARGETSVTIVPPRAALQTGFVRFDTLVVGDEIESVVFVLDERRLLAKTRPPYSVELDLGNIPRPHILRVEGLDAGGRLVARDELPINAGSQRFAVRLLEPRSGVGYSSSLLARARVDLPEERSLERLEFYLNDTLMATLFQEPFAQPIPVPVSEDLAYVRAVAYLPDGTSTEDLVFINAPEHLDQLDVQMVELYTSVFDPAGRPVLGLDREQFRIFEDDVRQQVLRFETLEDLPINVGILFDNSASMGPILDASRIAALSFFQEAISSRDKGALITFNRVPRLAVKLTSSLQQLGGGLAGLSAEGETALYDSLMFGLYYFTGIRGQRALLLLSDGKDEVSRFSFEETLDYARRAGVTLYVIGLNLQEAGAAGRLTQLADETGGRVFFIRDIRELAQVYARIQEELRSQYLLTYQSGNLSGDDSFRAIEVELADKRLTAHTLSGYYP